MVLSATLLGDWLRVKLDPQLQSLDSPAPGRLLSAARGSPGRAPGPPRRGPMTPPLLEVDGLEASTTRGPGGPGGAGGRRGVVPARRRGHARIVGESGVGQDDARPGAAQAAACWLVRGGGRHPLRGRDPGDRTPRWALHPGQAHRDDLRGPRWLPPALHRRATARRRSPSGGPAWTRAPGRAGSRPRSAARGEDPARGDARARVPPPDVVGMRERIVGAIAILLAKAVPADLG